METAAATTRELAEELAAKVRNLKQGDRFLLGIVGYPGAGKSTISQALVDAFNELSQTEASCVVPMDGYHFSNEKLDQIGLRPLKGIPQTFDAHAFVDLLEQLRETSKSIFAPKFDRGIEASINDGIELKPQHKLLVVEGNYLLLADPPWDKVRALLDEVWFIDTTFDTIYPRLLERHLIAGRTPDAARVKIESTDMPNARLIDSTKRFAHKLICVKLDS